MFASQLAAVMLLSQVGGPIDAPAPLTAQEDREAAAAERAAAAAEKTADALARLADVLAPKVAAAAAAKKDDGWTGSIGFGLTFLTGNAQQLTVTGNATADRKWEKWALGLRAGGAYGLSNPSANVATSTSQTTARRAGATLRGDRSFGTFASLFALGGVEFDHLKSVESRTVGELGSGLTFFNTKEGDLDKLYLRVDLAMRAGFETRYQYFPAHAPVDPYAIAILAPRVAVTFRWNFNKDVRFSEELEAIPFVLAPNAGRLLVNNTTKLAARITESVALTTSLVVGYDSQPPPSTPRRLTTDVALTVGLEAGF